MLSLSAPALSTTGVPLSSSARRDLHLGAGRNPDGTIATNRDGTPTYKIISTLQETTDNGHQKYEYYHLDDPDNKWWMKESPSVRDATHMQKLLSGFYHKPSNNVKTTAPIRAANNRTQQHIAAAMGSLASAAASAAETDAMSGGSGNQPASVGVAMGAVLPSSVCAVCGDGSDTTVNPLFQCDGNGADGDPCGLFMHNDCIANPVPAANHAGKYSWCPNCAVDCASRVQPGDIMLVEAAQSAGEDPVPAGEDDSEIILSTGTSEDRDMRRQRRAANKNKPSSGAYKRRPTKRSKPSERNAGAGSSSNAPPTNAAGSSSGGSLTAVNPKRTRRDILGKLVGKMEMGELRTLNSMLESHGVPWR